MSNVLVGPASPEEVRAILHRRACDDTTVRLALELAERGTVWVARDDAEVVGIAIVHDSQEERYVGDLFVEPSYRAAGAGRSLLEGAFLETGDRARTMLGDSADPAGVALALRQRLTLREPMIRFAGAIPREEELAKMAAGDYRFQVEPVDPIAHGFGLRALDRQTRGTTRDSDHLYFARNATGHAFFLRGEFVSYAYVWSDGRIGPLACASQNYLVQIFAYALLTLTRSYGASWCSTLLPGSNGRVARAALRGGLQMAQTHLLASDAPDCDLSTYVGYHPLLL